MPENQWLSMLEFQQTQASETQYLWLAERGSMTRQLMQAGLGRLKVAVLSSAHQMAEKEERLFLNLQQRSWPYIREVIMHVDNEAWMYGRTVIPTAALNGCGGQLRLLGEKPLGQLLFHNKTNARLFIEVAKISKHHYLYPTFMDHLKGQHLWARRSLFQYQNFPLLVQEVFLPNCPLQVPQ